MVEIVKAQLHILYFYFYIKKKYPEKKKISYFLINYSYSLLLFIQIILFFFIIIYLFIILYIYFYVNTFDLI